MKRAVLFGLAFALCFLSAAGVAAPRGHLTTSISASTYDGLVATRGSAPSGLLTQTQAMAVTAIFTRSAVTKIKIIIPNWYGAEIAPGGTLTATASIEYPPGTCTPFTFSSASSGTAANGGQIESDYLTISIPTNTKAPIREYLLGSAGIPFDHYQGQNLSIGDALVVGNSGVVDQTVSCGTVTDGGTFASIAPLAIIAPITIPSVCGLGDSKMIGVDNDFTPNSVGDNGEVMPSIGPSFGYSNMGVNADSASAFVGNHTNRAAILAYCSHVIVEYGTNDIYINEDSVATLQGNLTTIYGLAAGKTVFQNTLIARTTSSDFWATTAGQSVINGSGEESRRVAFNTALTSGSFGPNGGFFDPTPIAGTSTNNSIWKAGNPGFSPCVPNWTTDGVHWDTCSYYTVLPSSGYINTSRIHR